MIKKLLLVRNVSLVCNVLCLLLISPVLANAGFADNKMGQQDTLMTDTLDAAGLRILKGLNSVASPKMVRDSLIMDNAQVTPFISLQQFLKGNIAGLNVKETSGEPGTVQSMIVRGLAAPIFNAKDIYNQQPVVYLNGIPLIQDHPFAYDIQKYDYNRIGPATNLLAALDPSNINTIEVIKDPVELAKLGPMASNGAIWITTKNAKSGHREISINSYLSMVAKESITPTNGDYENRFRKPFYAKYANNEQKLSYAAYLRDSTNTDYYGPSKWDDLYYQSKPAYHVDMSLTGGSERANFRFFGSAMESVGNADNTGIRRYNASFYINMAPFEWLTMSSMMNATRLDRDRNKSLRDRFAETRYLPDLSTPLSPNKELYQSFLNEYDKSIDDNMNNIAQGYLALNFKLDEKFKFVTRFSFDYNEGLRDVFYPSTLMENNNFVSNYFGYNERYLLSNTLNYSNKINNHSIEAEVGHTYWSDTQKYNYATAYDGPNDFIKINVVNGSPSAGNYLDPVGFLVYRYTDRERLNMLSFHGSAKYKYKNLITTSLALRSDASSNMMPDSRWFVSPALSAGLNLKGLFSMNSSVNKLDATISGARIGETFRTDRFAFGPQYRVDMGWTGEPTMFSYNGISGVTRPYTSGWVGYDIENPYSNQLSFTLDGAFLKNRIQTSASFYSNTSKNMILNLPVPLEYGYTGKYASGMDVNNQGVDILLSGTILNRKDGLAWISGLNFNVNKNTLKSLPGDLDHIVIGNRKLQVGQSVDRFWLLENNGIYEKDSDVPVNPSTNKRMDYNGTPMSAGDPRWADQDGNYSINDDDKVLTGHMMPALTGGWNNDFKYNNWNLNFHFAFALGQDALNTAAASNYDFINRELSSNIDAIKEITSWQQSMDISKYPIYNPWSAVIPYRSEQDLFLENASYVKLRSLTLGYELGKSPLFNGGKKSFKRVYIYATGANLFTISPFSGSDPELVSLMGQYTSYGLPIPQTFMLGFKLDL